ncbi:RNA helicase aquarius-like isoform X2 [Mercenaria mercenaria]|uniref:RNA helicase aquarius-like isoform X2 n=1 Tax=Mercenaria mercenaria TaxID=6596 RepID=UPI00234F94F1|nr:RNA helicase aquarius-like isoform X2 [Mercenaria mercenaria]
MLSLLEGGQDSTQDREFLLELLVIHHERKKSQLEQINEMPMYPTEDIIWDENIVPTEYYNSEGTLALPKINLQFLTLHDYLLRNFSLFRLESTLKCMQCNCTGNEMQVFVLHDEGNIVYGSFGKHCEIAVRRNGYKPWTSEEKACILHAVLREQYWIFRFYANDRKHLTSLYWVLNNMVYRSLDSFGWIVCTVW